VRLVTDKKHEKRFENGESAKPLPGSSHALVR